MIRLAYTVFLSFLVKTQMDGYFVYLHPYFIL